MTAGGRWVSGGSKGGRGDSHDVEVVAVDGAGEPVASMSRRVAHWSPGVPHLAVSVQLVDPAGRWLLQRRAESKALFPGLWANSCCSHPLPGEPPLYAALRRTADELGLHLSELTPAGSFHYRARDKESGLVEDEHDHVFVGVVHTEAVEPDPTETVAVLRVPFDRVTALLGSPAGAPWG